MSDQKPKGFEKIAPTLIRGEELFFAVMLDIIGIIVVTILYFNFIYDFEYYQDLALLYFVVVFFHYAWVFLYNRGRTIGMMICGVAYASMYSGELLTRAEYHQLMFARIATDFKYNDSYEAYKFLTSSTFQTIAMKKLGIFYIRKRKYSKLYKNNK